MVVQVVTAAASATAAAAAVLPGTALLVLKYNIICMTYHC